MQKRILLHICFWIFYVLFKTFQNIVSNIESSPEVIAFPELKNYFLAQLVLLIVKVPMVYALFFSTEKYLIKNWSLFKTIVVSAWIYIVSLGLYLFVKQEFVLKVFYDLETSFTAALNITSIISSLFILFFVSSIALAIKLVRSNINHRKNEQELIKKKLETELMFLKGQTNPHFLFNTLNNIYALARKKSDDTADVVMKLSKLLRFVLYESNRPFIPFSEELSVMQSYIELEKIRYGKKLDIVMDVNIDNPSQAIAPLILLPFIENAFKHGASESRFASYIHIKVSLVLGKLDFYIKNSKSQEVEQSNQEKIGLKNVTRQLELMYPDHSLTIQNESDYFGVILKINLLRHAKI